MTDRGMHWRAGPWFVTQVDPDRVLSDVERGQVHDAGDQWSAATARGEITGDWYASSRDLVAALRRRYAVEHREPVLDPAPVDLDDRPLSQPLCPIAHRTDARPHRDLFAAAADLLEDS